MVALKGVWTVTAGVIPGHTVPDLTRQFSYTSVEYEEDVKLAESGEQGTTHFTRLMREAHDYARFLTNPAALNWVRLDWMWI